MAGRLDKARDAASRGWAWAGEKKEAAKEKASNVVNKTRDAASRGWAWAGEKKEASKEKAYNVVSKKMRFAGGAIKIGGGMAALAATAGLGIAGLGAAAAGSMNTFFIISLLLHFYDAFNNSFGTAGGGVAPGITGIRFGMYCFLMFYAWFVLFGGTSRGFNTLSKPAIISIIAFILPFFVSKLFDFISSVAMERTITWILLLFPIWPVIVVFGMAPPDSRFLKWMRISFIFIWAVIGLPTLYKSATADLAIKGAVIPVYDYFVELLKLFWSNLKIIWVGFLGGVTTAPSVFKGFLQEQVQYATGDYYTGMVDENKDEPVGVYYQNVQPSSSRFFSNEYITIWGLLVAKTLDKQDVDIMTISTSCYALTDVYENGQSTTRRVDGNADPGGGEGNGIMYTTVSLMEEKDITCEFAPDTLSQGTWRAAFSSTFNFEALSYLPVYFMDQARMRAFRRENRDPLDVYGVTNKNPSSVSTGGPVKIGMGATQPLIGLDMSPEAGRNEFRLGVTVENKWEGRIKEITDLTIKIPPSMHIILCDYNVKQEPCSGEECEDGLYTVVYKLQKSSEGGRRGSSAETFQNIKDYRTISCRVGMENPASALGGEPFKLHNFKASVKYIYELNAETSFEVKGTEII